MDNKKVKERNVLDFKEFVKVQENSHKPVMTKKGENPDPGGRPPITPEPLYFHNDANPYVAAGLMTGKEEDANRNDKMNARQVDVFPQDGEVKKDDAAVKKINTQAEDDAMAIINTMGMADTEG